MDETIAAYNNSAKEIAQYFAGIGPRIKDIDRALQLAKCGNNARVLEIGCGDGRDATEIIKRVGFYEGFDPSEGLLALAKEKLPDESFVLADSLSYQYPQHIDVIYSFASLLHSPIDDVAKICQKVSNSLNEKGVLYISLKEKKTYQSGYKEDAFGKRLFYFYSVPDVVKAAGSDFELVYESHQKIGDTEWFTVALKKVANSENI